MPCWKTNCSENTDMQTITVCTSTHKRIESYLRLFFLFFLSMLSVKMTGLMGLLIYLGLGDLSPIVICVVLLCSISEGRNIGQSLARNQKTRTFWWFCNETKIPGEHWAKLCSIFPQDLQNKHIEWTWAPQKRKRKKSRNKQGVNTGTKMLNRVSWDSD